MPWWSWLIIWGGLGLALVIVLAALTWWLFRKVMRVFAELETLASKAELLDTASDMLDAQRYTVAILQKRADVRDRRRLVRERSALRRGDRHDARLARARALTGVDANTRRWFEAD